MGKRIDLSGQRFGRLLVLEYFGNDKSKNALFRCSCDCGTEKEIIVKGILLRRGETKSCGCYNRERLSAAVSKEKEMIGKKFGKLTVIEKVGKNKDGHFLFLCICDCENKEVIINGKSLRNGTTKSCGCYQKERITEARSKENEMLGSVFGMLRVINKVGTTKDGRNLYSCICSCNNVVDVSGHSLQSGNTISCGCLKDSFVAHELKKYCLEKYESISEYSILKNPITGYPLPFDIYIPIYKIFIEVMGEQHYSFDGFFHKTHQRFEDSVLRDSIKKEYAEKNGYYFEIDLRKIKNPSVAIEQLENFISVIL